MMQLRMAATDSADINPIAEIDRHAFGWPWNRVYFRGELASRQAINFTLKTVDDENRQKVIGYIICRLVNRELHILRIAVKPQWRGHGLAGRLLARAFGQAAKSGARSAYLEVRPSNKSAIALYHRQGFRLIGKKPQNYTDTREDALVLMKTLKEDL